MGFIYTLSGPSGVGKTTLLNNIDLSKIQLIPRYTDRPMRSDEKEGFEYYFTNYDGILQKVYANDFIHFEKWGDYHSGIETRIIKEIIQTEYDGLVLASVFGASRLKAAFGNSVIMLYLWTGEKSSLYNPQCFEDNFSEIKELKWRITKKIQENNFSEYEIKSFKNDEFLEKRMIDNYLDIASVNGRLRAGEDISVIPNIRDKLFDAIEYFDFIRQNKNNKIHQYRMNKKCFVLMPFKNDLRPVYDDHICKICEELNISVSRADQIFSTNPVIEDIIQAVKDADVIIADLTDNNPNVFYEIGICHMLKKQVVLITQSETVPFDLSHIRRIKYSFTPKGMIDFEDLIRNTLRIIS